jgi:hypothetical protein
MWNFYKTMSEGKPIAVPAGAAAGSVPEPMWT